MNSTNLPEDHFSLYDSSLDQFYDMATSAEESGGNTIFNELSTEYQRYWITHKITEGGSKQVLKVKDSSTNRHIAMALPKSFDSAKVVEDFLREARLTASLQHPNIMPVYDIGLNSAKHPFFTMKLIEHGCDLSQISDTSYFSERFSTLLARLSVFFKICDGVGFAHANGIIHMDLKPENIQLDRFGQVLICDWGLARFTKGHKTSTNSRVEKVSSMDFLNITLNGMVQGTPGFMAPEQSVVDKTIKDERTDIYSLGALLYFLLCFQSPIKSGELKKMLSDTVNGEIIPLSRWQNEYKIPNTLIKICAKAMSIKKECRYQSVEQLQDDVRAYIGGYATTAQDAGLLTKMQLFYTRNKVRCNIILVALLSFSIFAGYSIRELKINKEEAIKNWSIAERNLAELTKAQEEKQSMSKAASAGEVLKVRKLLSSHKYSDAYRRAKNATLLDPNNNSGWRNLAILEFSAQKFKKAKKAFIKDFEISGDKETRAKIQQCDELDKLIDPNTKRLNQKVLADFVKNNTKNSKAKLMHNHLLYRHRKNLLSNE